MTIKEFQARYTISPRAESRKGFRTYEWLVVYDKKKMNYITEETNPRKMKRFDTTDEVFEYLEKEYEYAEKESRENGEEIS